jgi:hypothetical protein
MATKNNGRERANDDEEPLENRIGQKSISISRPRVNRARPTNGSDCGSLRDHNLTLFVTVKASWERDKQTPALKKANFVNN